LRLRSSSLFPYTTLFRSVGNQPHLAVHGDCLSESQVLDSVVNHHLEVFDTDDLLPEVRYYAEREVPVRDSVSKSPLCLGTLRIRSEEHTSELQSRENLVC